MRLNDFKLAAYKAAVNAKKRDANVRRRKIQQQREESAQKHALGKRAALQHPYLEIPPEMMLTRDYLSGVAGKRRYNVTYADYFDFLAQDQGDPKFTRIADSVRNCHKHWYGEYTICNRFSTCKTFYFVIVNFAVTASISNRPRGLSGLRRYWRS